VLVHSCAVSIHTLSFPSRSLLHVFWFCFSSELDDFQRHFKNISQIFFESFREAYKALLLLAILLNTRNFMRPELSKEFLVKFRRILKWKFFFFLLFFFPQVLLKYGRNSRTNWTLLSLKQMHRYITTATLREISIFFQISSISRPRQKCFEKLPRGGAVDLKNYREGALSIWNSRDSYFQGFEISPLVWLKSISRQ
jgi:hypothetical protein